MPRRLLSAAAACTLLFGLAACDGGSEGTVTTPPPSIDVTGPSDGGGSEPSDGGGSTEAAPDVPAPDPAVYAGMDENTPEGAEQAFRYYIAVSMWSHRTGDVEILSALEGANCSGCSDLNAKLPSLQEAERYWGAYEVRDDFLEAFPGETYDQEVSYYFVLSEHQEPDLESGGTTNVSETEFITTGGMVWSEGRWLVDGLQGEWGPNVFKQG
jgi:hypothetical protein